MNRLRIMLNNRKRFVFLAAMAAVLVLLAGGANALAFPPGYTVRCVRSYTSHTMNSSCTATDYATIQAAVNAANPGDIILVAAGKYTESVKIDETGHNRDHISLLGAQAGNDARIDRHDPAKESIVDASGTGNSAIIVEAEAVVIDGFTARGATQGGCEGIDLKGSNPPATTDANGAIVVNNILTNNSTGVSLNWEGYGPSTGTGAVLVGVLVEHNLFKTNNAGKPSVWPGYGIMTFGVQHAIITENAFYGNTSAALLMEWAQDVTISNNTSNKDAVFVDFVSTTNVVFSGNQGENFAANGVSSNPELPIGDAALSVGARNQYLVISDNCLEEGKAPISNGIAFTTVFGTSATNTKIYVKNNRIKCFPGTGILAESGMLTDSFILGNEVKDNHVDGIYIDDLGGNEANSLFDNEAEGNHVFDCHDDTSGNRTVNTANTWFHNTGNYVQPTGLCTREKRH